MSFNWRLVLAMALVFTGAMASLSFAQNTGSINSVGAAEYELLISILTGTPGMFIGMVVALCGIWQLVVNQDNKAGIILLILGVMLTLLPTFYNGMRAIACPIAASLGASCGNSSLPSSS